jgi:hypothetical protein
MSATVAAGRSSLDRILAPFLDCLTPEVARRIAAVRADAETQAQLDTLAEKNAEGTITPAEREEYELLVAAAGWIAVLQAKARAIAAG